MAAYNYGTLRWLIKQKTTFERFAKMGGIPYPTLSLKLAGKSEFRQREMENIVRAIGKSVNDIPELFYTPNI